MKTRDAQQTTIPLNLTNEQQSMLNNLSFSRSYSSEELAHSLKISISQVLIQLSLLEIRGFVTMDHGKYIRV